MQYEIKFLCEKYLADFFLTFNDQCPHHIETSHLIFSANQLTGFYMMGTLVVKWLSGLSFTANPTVLYVVFGEVVRKF